MRIAFGSTPVGFLGSGIGGGVETGIQNLATGLQRRGHIVEVFAPRGSRLNEIVVHEVDGTSQQSMQNFSRDSQIEPVDGTVLEAIWNTISSQQDRFDIVLNFAYDALPMQLTPLFKTPIVHLVSMASTTSAMDRVIEQTSHLNRFAIAMHSRAQLKTYPRLANSVVIVGSGVNFANHQFEACPGGSLGFVGRISPEKGFRDAVVVAQLSGLPLEVWGAVQDGEYLAKTIAENRGAVVNFHGFVAQADLATRLGELRALIVPSKWVEAFGNVVVEAMASGVPVIAYRQGGLAEIIDHGKTGFLVDPDDIDQMVAFVQRIDEIDRSLCRQTAHDKYSVDSFACKVESWLFSRLG